MENVNENAIVEKDVTEASETTLVLKKPVEINGELVKEIPYNLDDLTGQDIADTIKMLGRNGIVVVMSETDSNYHAGIFATASGLDYNDVKKLSAKDYNKACNLVRDFFLEE